MKGAMGSVEISIFDITGRGVITPIQSVIAQEACQIDVSVFVPGVYILQLKQDGQLANRKFVIAR